MDLKRSAGRWVSRIPVAAVALIALAGCARPEPPPGGPLDLEPPVILASTPDSGAVQVPRMEPIRITFSKRMDRRSVEDYIFTSPPIRFGQLSWSGREFQLTPLDSLRANTTYLAVIGSGARDIHGNGLARPENLVFSTGERLARGKIRGRVEAPRGLGAGIFVWLYEDALHPDSTWGSDDPDYTVQAGGNGQFEIAGLSPERQYSLHLFSDSNRNRAFDPESEYMLHVPRRITLTDSVPEDTSLVVSYVDPKTPGSISGRLDTTLTRPKLAIRLDCPADSGLSQTVLPDLKGGFLLRATPPAKYRIYWFEDLDQDRQPGPAEPRGPAADVELKPGEDVIEVRISREGPPVIPAAPGDRKP